MRSAIHPPAGDVDVPIRKVDRDAVFQWGTSATGLERLGTPREAMRESRKSQATFDSELSGKPGRSVSSRTCSSTLLSRVRDRAGRKPFMLGCLPSLGRRGGVGGVPRRLCWRDSRLRFLSPALVRRRRPSPPSRPLRPEAYCRCGVFRGSVPATRPPRRGGVEHSASLRPLCRNGRRAAGDKQHPHHHRRCHRSPRSRRRLRLGPMICLCPLLSHPPPFLLVLIPRSFPPLCCAGL